MSLIVEEYGTPAPPVERRLVSVFNFKARFTSAERIAARNLAKTDADVFDFLDLVDSIKSGVDLNDAMTAAGVNLLVSKGVLTSQRAATILNAPVQGSELP